MKKIILAACLLILLTGCSNQQQINQQKVGKTEQTTTKIEKEQTEPVVEKEENENTINNEPETKEFAIDNQKETASWKTYQNSKLGLQFKYPDNWFVREEITEYNNRIYIENQEYKNYNIGNYPEDFLGMWIDYRKPTIETLSYEDQIKEFNNMSAKKELIKSGVLEINTYEFSYNPNSERSGVGPYLEAVWYNNSWIYNATTMDSEDKENNEKKVNILKKILSTIEFKN